MAVTGQTFTNASPGEIEHMVEMPDHLIVIVETPVVKIGRVEVGVTQGRRLEQAAGADVMLLVIDETS